MGHSLSPDTDGRHPCPRCGTLVLEGAKKCRGCHAWLEPASRPRARTGRSLVLLVGALAALAMGLVVQRESPVGEAPPLTPLPAGSPTDDTPIEAPAALGPDGAEVVEPLVLQDDDVRHIDWRVRQLRLDAHPLDLAFDDTGETIFVSTDDATLRQYDVRSGKLLHKASMPAQGDRIVVLFGRYVALIRTEQAAHIPIVDTQNWDREPLLLWVGSNPADIVELPDGETVVTASSRGKRLSAWNLATRRRMADLKLPHATRQLLMLRLDERPYVGAMGILDRGGRPSGAFVDLFDPSEDPFGATRRSVAVGRDSRGVVSPDGNLLLFVDEAANTVGLVDLASRERVHTITVGQGPLEAFFMRGGNYAVTLDAEARTATVIDVPHRQRLSTLMLPGTPRHGAVSADGKWLFVSLGGAGWPPVDRGVAVIADDPLKVMTELDTGRGATRVATAPIGHRAAVANYLDRAITLIEPRK
jgi:YVTN family beta-propeller protein